MADRLSRLPARDLRRLGPSYEVFPAVGGAVFMLEDGVDLQEAQWRVDSWEAVFENETYADWYCDGDTMDKWEVLRRLVGGWPA